MTEAAAPPGTSFLATRQGKLTLVLLCAVALLDLIGPAIMNIALPAIQRDLHPQFRPDRAEFTEPSLPASGQ
jgi:hypothetical protein